MIRLFVTAIALIFVCSGCSNYDYFENNVTGVVIYENINTDINQQCYDGETVCTNNVLLEDNCYSDSNIYIVKVEYKLSICIINVLYCGGSLLQDAFIDFSVVDSNNKVVGTESISTDLVNGYISSIIVPVSEGNQLYLQKYGGNPVQIAQIIQNDFGKIIEQKSQSTYYVSKSGLYYFLNDNNVILDKCNCTKEYISNRYGAKRYIEVVIE